MDKKFRIPVPGDLDQEITGRNYYALDKKDRLNIVGENARPSIIKRYELWFSEESAAEHEIGQLPREHEVNPSD